MAIVLYILFYSLMQHRREVNGPWEVTFVTDNAGRPSLKINEPKLGISQEISFSSQKTTLTNLDDMETFADAVTNLPFGKMVFQDPEFLPGTVTMWQFGHEIELLPRVLIIDKQEIPWGIKPVIEVASNTNR